MNKIAKMENIIFVQIDKEKNSSNCTVLQLLEYERDLNFTFRTLIAYESVRINEYKEEILRIRKEIENFAYEIKNK